jgi:very-short-patch-repair endonuclease
MDNSYRERTDKAVTVAFTLKDKPQNAPEADEYKILAWTTTPWTLPSNLALALGKDIEYACVVVENYSPLEGELGGDVVADRGGYKPDTLEKARDLRKEQTKEEAKLWQYLSGKKLDNYKFRRQHPIDKYIVDFFCPSANLIVELDGSQHVEQKEYDDKRTAFLQVKGYKVLRFWNNDVNGNIEGVIEKILDVLKNTNTPHEISTKSQLPLKGGVKKVCYILAESALDKYEGILTENSLRYFVLTKDELISTINGSPLSDEENKGYQIQRDIVGIDFRSAGGLKGSSLVGLSYKPLFPYFADTKDAFKIVAGNFVTEGDGTGIVHLAPGFGEDDFEVCKKENIAGLANPKTPVICPVDNSGKYTTAVYDLNYSPL